MFVKKLVPAVLTAALLAGCTTGGTKETVGTVGGAVAGGLIGSQIGGGSGKLVATGVGTLLGAFVGSQVGSSLDKADAEYASGAARRAYAAPVGDRIAWNNPQSGNSGTVTTTRDGYSSAGTYCREYQQTVAVGGKTEMAYGTACKQPDGTWKIIGNS
ncbi:RT0821/Lpp0805 family surface protein [Azospirillum doebereinerae]|uniref:17 kDa surface antigen n=1 Tax=Azospirillum doebereinerae TaxID=92933 RepID=A0A433J8B3_9PROT|nr:RT0821/Lpp0805 family surface protein [Azospirillum doebereinerae]MCG5241703.1 glycine zipper 2TM domain-containing protein [Azospirillum doebereinerae]RUQ70210.1 glycine zipper 2TM domain-containing protein [Azospirillum doebereinerae]